METAAFTAAFPTQARWGFDQGFDIYHDPLERAPSVLDWRDQRTADEVVDDAMRTLEGEDGDWFVWVHLFDPHWPYEAPEPFASRHRGRPYDAEIAFSDHQLGRLLAWWDAKNPESVVVVTADHGEGLAEGGEQTHGFLLHDGTMRVPMLMRGPGIGRGEVISDPVGHADIVPTVLAVVGLEGDEQIQGLDLRDGGSKEIYAEALTGRFQLGLAPLYSLSTDDGRYTEGVLGRVLPPQRRADPHCA